MMSEDRLAHVTNRIDKINSVLDRLWELADDDDIITPDEQGIIRSVRDNIESYKQLANKLTSGENISDEELERLYIFEKKIVQDASSEALNDGHISGEEGDLLQVLLEFFENLND